MADASAPRQSMRSVQSSKGKNVRDDTEHAPGKAKDYPIEGSSVGSQIPPTSAIDATVLGAAKEQVPCLMVVGAAQDIMKVVMTLLEKNNCSGVILSANGCISQAAVTNHASGTVYHEGHFDILLVRGLCDPVNGNKVEIMLSKDDAVVFGGILTGSLIAASPVQVVLLAQVPQA